MSPLSRNELSIVLAPECVTLARTERTLTRHGFKISVQDRNIFQCELDEGGEKPWGRAIATLEAALPSMTGNKMDVNVVLSNHFMQYVLVPWFDKITDAEELALARHCFSEVYGDAAESLSVRVSPGRAGAAALASAVDMRLLEDMGGLLGRMKLDIKTIQPHLMVAYNSCVDRLEGSSAWVALMEPGNLCLAVLSKGQMVWIRKLRIGDDWRKELPAILEREAYLADSEVAMDEVLLWAPHLKALDMPTGWRWKIEQLKPGCKSGYGRPDYGLHHLEVGLE